METERAHNEAEGSHGPYSMALHFAGGCGRAQAGPFAFPAVDCHLSVQPLAGVMQTVEWPQRGDGVAPFPGPKGWLPIAPKGPPSAYFTTRTNSHCTNGRGAAELGLVPKQRVGAGEEVVAKGEKAWDNTGPGANCSEICLCQLLVRRASCAGVQVAQRPI